MPDLSTEAGIHRLSQMMGDPSFNVIGTISARKMAALTAQPVYEYLYTHEGTFSTTDVLIGGIKTFLIRVIIVVPALSISRLQQFRFFVW